MCRTVGQISSPRIQGKAGKALCDVMAARAKQHLLGNCHDIGLAGWSASGDGLHALLPQASQQAIQHCCARAQSCLIGPHVWLIGGPVDGVQALLHTSERARRAGCLSM